MYIYIYKFIVWNIGISGDLSGKCGDLFLDENG